MTHHSESRGPSEHLSWKEVACRDGCGFSLISTRVCETYEAIRAEVGRIRGKEVPVHVLSGCRCAKHNATIKNAASTSRHMTGEALDLRTPTSMEKEAFWEVCNNCNPHGGVGYYSWGCHIDCRGEPKRWNG